LTKQPPTGSGSKRDEVPTQYQVWDFKAMSGCNIGIGAAPSTGSGRKEMAISGRKKRQFRRYKKEQVQVVRFIKMPLFYFCYSCYSPPLLLF